MDGSWTEVFPYFAGAFKLIVLGIGAYFAIKWHFDEERRVREAQGMVFVEPSFMKRLAMMIALPVVLVSVVVLVIYITKYFYD